MCAEPAVDSFEFLLPGSSQETCGWQLLPPSLPELVLIRHTMGKWTGTVV